jgi:hypothetical protein
MGLGGFARLGVCAVAASALLSACSGPEPKEPDTAPSSPTPTATAPSMPDQAKEDSAEGAAAFVTHYVDVLNHASNTGDTTQLERLSSPDCTGCQSYITLYRDTYEAGGYFKGKSWTLSELEPTREDHGWVVFARVAAPPGTYRTEDDAMEIPGESVDTSIGFRVSGSDSAVPVVAEFGLKEET